MKIFAATLFLTAVISCSMTATKNRQKSKPYAKLMVALGEDVSNQVQCVAEFYKAPDDIKTIALEEGTKVLLDNLELQHDTSYYPNYVLERKPSEFIGTHKWSILFKGGEKKEYNFEVKPFTITSIIPDEIGQTDLVVKCDNLKSTDKVFLMLSADFTDERENSLDITPQEGFFTIPKSFFRKVDPVSLEMHFNISRIDKVINDSFFKEVEIEWTKITKRYKARIRHH